MTGSFLVVSLHDVSPHTRNDCTKILAQLHTLGVRHCSLLVVPDHHRRGHFLRDSAFCVWLQELHRAGHEIVVHGYHHQRPRKASETMQAKFTTRFYTADEGEFFDLYRSQAAALVDRARGEFRQLGFEPAGFIAPAWLLSTEAENALCDLGFEYTTRLGSVTDLRSKKMHRSQSLCWSVRGAWRRVVSRGWNALLVRRLASNPLLRIAIHPVDLRHRAVWRQITTLVRGALVEREALTYQSWLARWRSEGS